MSIWSLFTRAKPEATVTMLRRLDTSSLSALRPKWVLYYGKDSGQVRLLEKLVAQRKGYRGA